MRTREQIISTHWKVPHAVHAYHPSKAETGGPRQVRHRELEPCVRNFAGQSRRGQPGTRAISVVLDAPDAEAQELRLSLGHIEKAHLFHFLLLSQDLFT